MKQFTVDGKLDGKKLIRIVLAQYPGLGISQVRQALRNRDIRVNGKRLKSDIELSAGDEVSLYLPDEAFAGKSTGPSGQPLYRVVYEDDQVIAVNKRSGVTVHAAGREQGPYLIDQMRQDFADDNLQLCHRLDRQTGGLLLVARTAEALQAVRQAIRDGHLVKRYRCLVKGVPAQGRRVQAADGIPFFEARAYLEKIPSRSDVFIHDQKASKDLEITTRYRVLKTFAKAGPDGESVSELEVELVTGRTHQIRAHLAHLGHPVLGDGKYGRNSYNRHFSSRSGLLHGQQLFATTLFFAVRQNGPLAKLAGRTVVIEPEYDWTGPNQ